MPRTIVEHQLLVENSCKYSELVNAEESKVMLGLRRQSAIRGYQSDHFLQFDELRSHFTFQTNIRLSYL